MAVNREAIHGAKVWRKSSEGPTKMQEGQFSDQKRWSIRRRITVYSESWKFMPLR